MTLPPARSTVAKGSALPASCACRASSMNSAISTSLVAGLVNHCRSLASSTAQSGPRWPRDSGSRTTCSPDRRTGSMRIVASLISLFCFRHRVLGHVCGQGAVFGAGARRQGGDDVAAVDRVAVLAELQLAFEARDLDFESDDAAQHAGHVVLGQAVGGPGIRTAGLILS